MVCFNGNIYNQDEEKFEFNSDIEEGNFSGWSYFNKYALLPREFHFVSVVLRIYYKDFLCENKLWFKNGIYHEDNLFTPLACYYADKVRVTNVSGYNYRKRKGSIMSLNLSKRIKDKVWIANELCSFFIPIKEIDKENLYKILASDYIGIFKQALISRYPISGLEKEINSKFFKQVCITLRHKLLFIIISIHPRLLLFYYRLSKLIH